MFNYIYIAPGPMIFFPKPFQTLDENKSTKKFYFPMEVVTQQEAIHLQCVDGTVVILDKPQFYMPKVSEGVCVCVCMYE